jgi:hypothetical protein
MPPSNWLKRPVPLLVCKLDRCQRSQAGVWANVIVVVAPGLDDRARFGEPEEKMFIEALVAKFAVEAFDESVLHRLAGLYVVSGDPLGGPA